MVDQKLQIDPSNLAYLEQLEEKLSLESQTVEGRWQKFFSQYEEKEPVSNGSASFKDAEGSSEREKNNAIADLIEAYRSYGHLNADINPLYPLKKELPWQLKLSTWGLDEKELEKIFSTHGFLKNASAPLSEIVAALQKTYCGKIGIEYMGVQNLELEKWLQEQIEPNFFTTNLNKEKKHKILQQLNSSELFETFLHTKYTGQKRFSLEGGETLIPMLSAILEQGSEEGIKEFVIGMAHRGRLNVLSNILNKSYKDIFSEFDEWHLPSAEEGSGDVKYHKGYSSKVTAASGLSVKVLLAPNPSHLDSVDPVVEGMVRGRQKQNNAKETIPILIHGDAALSGQGVIYETLQFFKLKGYSTGGTIHIAINNQVGFTTLPEESRSTLYCTDIAKAFGSPVFHVNAEEPESCVYATLLALNLRQKFHCDVFIDLNCYRKYGHNESDEPAYTQPLLYQIIRKKKAIREVYRDYLIKDNELTQEAAEKLEQEFKEQLQQELERKIPEPVDLSSYSIPTSELEETEKKPQTAVEETILVELAQKFCSIPENFSLHSKLKNLLNERLQMVEKKGKFIDWGMAETLAYASLLMEGISIRLSGQDSCRGTFSHRHALWIDQKNGSSYSPLSFLKQKQGEFEVFNSPLSEYAVLGFEYGYSVANLDALVIWEAQFGDFCNGAQIIIDQFIASGEKKWGQKSSVVLFLPHGYEGQGSEHSSGRMERFLALAAEGNMEIVNPTTPAQFFHLLRVHALQKIKRPLIIFTPKGLLRHPQCISYLEDFSHGEFNEVIDERSKAKASTLIFCSGRIFYDLLNEANSTKNEYIALIRLEQLYPFPKKALEEIIKKYQDAKRFIWVQEEPVNMGAWEYIRAPLQGLLPNNQTIEYIGRARSAAPASGSHARHKQELEALLKAIFLQAKV